MLKRSCGTWQRCPRHLTEKDSAEEVHLKDNEFGFREPKKFKTNFKNLLKSVKQDLVGGVTSAKTKGNPPQMVQPVLKLCTPRIGNAARHQKPHLSAWSKRVTWPVITTQKRSTKCVKDSRTASQNLSKPICRIWAESRGQQQGGHRRVWPKVKCRVTPHPQFFAKCDFSRSVTLRTHFCRLKMILLVRKVQIFNDYFFFHAQFLLARSKIASAHLKMCACIVHVASKKDMPRTFTVSTHRRFELSSMSWAT